MWFLNLFIVLEPSLNIECVYVFFFICIKRRKKKGEVRPLQKKVPTNTKKKKEKSLFDRILFTIVCILVFCGTLLTRFCGFWSLKVPHSLGIVLEYIRVRQENLSEKFEWKKAQVVRLIEGKSRF